MQFAVGEVNGEELIDSSGLGSISLQVEHDLYTLVIVSLLQKCCWCCPSSALSDFCFYRSTLLLFKLRCVEVNVFLCFMPAPMWIFYLMQPISCLSLSSIIPYIFFFFT